MVPRKTVFPVQVTDNARILWLEITTHTHVTNIYALFLIITQHEILCQKVDETASEIIWIFVFLWRPWYFYEPGSLKGREFCCSCFTRQAWCSTKVPGLLVRVPRAPSQCSTGRLAYTADMCSSGLDCWFLLRALKDSRSQASPLDPVGLLVVFDILWILPLHSDLCLSLLTRCFPRVPICVQVSLFHKDTTIGAGGPS